MLTTQNQPRTAAGRSTTARARAMAEVTLFVGVWMALGWPLGGNALGYLLLGIPLTIAFQLGVRRRPLRELWVRDGAPFRVDAKGKAIAAALIMVPAVRLVQDLGAGQWADAAFMGAALAGAVVAGYALRQIRRDALPGKLRWLAIAFVPGLPVLAVGMLSSGFPPEPVLTVLSMAGFSLLVQIPMAFVLEEVAFRGALDSHAHHGGERHQWLSALFVSALWGLWHLPIAGGGPLLTTIAAALVTQCLIGAGLSFAWRRTGNLAVPGVAHALMDSLRNGLALG